MTEVILTLNPGSSSLKFSLFSCQNKDQLLYEGDINDLTKASWIRIYDAAHNLLVTHPIASQGIKAGITALLAWLALQKPSISLQAVGHRVVHGGKLFTHPTLVTAEVLKTITKLIPLAPFHQPQSLEAIQSITEHYPNLPQVLCFDTMFHHTQARLTTLFALPKTLLNEGMVRYGFHGLSYEYIASVLCQTIGEIGNQRVMVAHLGNGASICAMRQGKSVASSTGLTVLDGLMMGSRCGSLDPGIILYLIDEKQCSVEAVRNLLYLESGLLGVSGISHDIRELQTSSAPDAIEAVDLFCYFAAKELTALCTSIQGCDAIIFTAGIGEQSALVRKKICEHLQWLGVVIDEQANNHHATIISNQVASKILVAVIPTHENLMIAKHTIAALRNLP